LDQLLELAVNSCAELAIAQREALGEALGI
jgi:hypothetical protein